MSAMSGVMESAQESIYDLDRNLVYGNDGSFDVDNAK